MSGTQRTKHVAMVPPPGFLGHLIPFIELSKKLLSSSHVGCSRVTIIMTPDGTQMKPQKALLENLPPEIDLIFLPPANTNDLPRNIDPQILYPTLIIRSLPYLRNTLSSSLNTVSALVVDLFAPFAIDVARELGIRAYIFYTAAASELALSINLPNLDKEFSCEFRDLPAPLKMPGSSTDIAPEDLPDVFHDRSSDVYKMCLEMTRKFHSADGIIVNTFLDFEEHAFEFMEDNRHQWPPAYPIGPLIRLDSDEESMTVSSHDRCLKWLNDQPPRSVLYVSFGSGATLSREQFNELALGLEMSRHRFLWVVRSPQDNAAVAYLNKEKDIIEGEKEDLSFLPLGFSERVRDRGLLVPNWAPQIKILGHEAVGGFMTHCGWNSLLESVVFGVPLLVRPLVFEQKMNAVLVADCLQVGIRLKEDENGIVGREEIARNVKELMEGETLIVTKIRNKIAELKNAALKALEADGSSSKALADVFGQ